MGMPSFRLWILPSIVLGMLCLGLIWNRPSPSSAIVFPAILDEEALLKVVEPTPNLHPSDVVRRQILALRRAGETPSELATCFALASTSNQMVTGPLEKFSKLVLAEPYHWIANSSQFSLTSPDTIDDQTVTIIASFANDLGQHHSYRFIVVRESEGKFQRCWRTDGVFALFPKQESLELEENLPKP